MFFTRFVTGNIFSVAVIGIILLLKKLLKNRASLRFHYHIWFALLLSLAVVFMPASFFKWIDFGNITREITTMQSNISVNTASAPDMAEDWLYDFTEMVDVADKAELNAIFLIIWIIGALCVAVFYCFGGRKLKAIKRFAEPPPENIIALFNDCLTKTSVKQRVRLMQSDMVTSTLSFGYIHCWIVLPGSVIQNLSEKEIEHILMHEITHIKHNDIWTNGLFCTAQILYWFNPFIWSAFSRMRCDREAYCDWSVLNIYNTEEERLCYGDTLLKFARLKKGKLIYSANGLFDNKAQLKYRIERIAGFKKETKLAKTVGCSLIAVVFFSAAMQIPVFTAAASDFGLSYVPERKIEIIEQDHSDLFGTAHGCAVIYDMQADVYNVYNLSAATKRIAPCSTFKIYSALNALEQGIITPDDSFIQWDNVSRNFPSWNSDQDLNSAMRNSVNWYFQLLDKASGADKLQDFYTGIGYGNGYVGKDTAYYWNGSNLKISPLEQVELLVKLYNNGFGFNESNVEAVKNAIFLSENNGNKLYGKTGTGKVGSNDVNGWFVGYAEVKGNTYFFAVNLQDESNANGNAAVQITYSIFEKMGISIN
ncbi:BlaR1 family beta-lactam sensor/signal transducer [Ruminococcus sp.]|uniref:BlaR1 family beta-lactam sensor/signal transducer n=1 Tax=Ruminococcus sp. TaxID=41978 RepID=UPI00386DA35E